MVVVAPPLLSDHPPEIPLKAGLGDRFHYFRGRSGRRYLFTLVSGESLEDFRNVVAMLAEPAPAGRLAAHALVTLDALGRIDAAAGRSPLSPSGSQDLWLVHLLATSDAERRAVIADLAVPPLQLAA